MARSWQDTPYVLGARVKGGGCDCGTFLAGWMVECGLASEDDVPDLAALGVYGHDWFCNTAVEIYFNELSRHARCTWEGRCLGTPPGQPGDIALFRVAGSRLYNHGCIITGWPRALHAFNCGVCESRPGLHPLTAHCEMAIFDPWSK